MNLHTASGNIENLRIVEAQQNIVFGPHMQEAAGISALVFAAAGMGGAAVGTSMNSDTAEDVNLYSFDLNDVKYAGCTRKATFQNGEHVELVFEAKPKGNEVLAVRRPSTRSIWLYPFMSRGSVAAKRFGIMSWLRWSLGFSVGSNCLFVLFELISHRLNFDGGLFLYLVPGTTLLIFLLLGFFGFIFAPKYLRFSEAANEVFAAYGYKEPAIVDLGKTTRAYRKTNSTPLTWDNKAELWY